MSNDLISREALREQIDDCEYFDSSFQKMTVAEFLTIVHDIINDAPTVAESCKELQKVATERPHIIDNCDMAILGKFISKMT